MSKIALLDSRLARLRGAIKSGKGSTQLWNAAGKVRLAQQSIIKAKLALIREDPRRDAEDRQFSNLRDHASQVERRRMANLRDHPTPGSALVDTERGFTAAEVLHTNLKAGEVLAAFDPNGHLAF